VTPTPPTEAPRYRILWAACSRDSEVGRRIGALEDLWLPYLVDGESLRRIEAGQGVPLDDYELLEGLLVAYFARPDDSPPDLDTQPAFRRALEAMVEAFARPSVEVTVLEIARALGARHGWIPARAALRTGRVLVPESAQLACDYAVASWRCLETHALPVGEVAHEILALAPKVATAGLRPIAAQYLAVVEVAALVAAHPEGDWRDAVAACRERVSDAYLTQKLDDLLRVSLPLDPAAFDLFESRATVA
jgi:hypothetical protein